MDGAELAGGDALADDRGHRARHGAERLERLAIEMHAAFGDLAQHDGGKERVFVDERRHRRDGAIDLDRRRMVAGGDALQTFGRAGEHEAEEGAVEALLAREMVVEYRLVHPCAVGDAVDASSRKAALRELERR